ncbi:peptide chain release factor N(5)-glutamine methyltransferase [Candidatus Peregrinibacteria bacterium]|nr:peptide chain release factor N(5)-glutamine methyltransferase [Candidatus Peregrinibacteria bacterium]
MNIAQVLSKESFFLDALDRELALSHVLGVSREYLISHSRDEIDGSMVKLYDSYLERLKKGEPVAYITNEKQFFGLDFYVDKRVLIPRPETEHLVEKALDYYSYHDETVCHTALDVGTGSGNVAIAIAENSADTEVWALDIDEGACEVAKLNAAQHGVDDRVRILQSDLLDVIDEGESFDVIVANLPYIGKVRNNFVSESTEKYEPELALFGGFDGLELYKKLFQQIIEKEIEFGILIGEFGFSQRKDLEVLLNQYFVHKWEIEKDLAGIDRIFICCND